jgi:hypothetical protein
MLASCIIDPKAFSSFYWILDVGRTRVSLNVFVSNLFKLPSRRIAKWVDWCAHSITFCIKVSAALTVRTAFTVGTLHSRSDPQVFG